MSRETLSDSDTDWDSIYDETHDDNDASSITKSRTTTDNDVEDSTDTTPTPAAMRAGAPSSAAWATEATPLLDAGPPPPTYLDAIGGRRLPGVIPSPPLSERQPSYRSGEQASANVVDGSLFPTDRGPASMVEGGAHGDGGGDGGPSEDVEQQSGKQHKRHRFRRRCSQVHKMIVIIAVVLVVTALVSKMTIHDGAHTGDGSSDGDDDTLPGHDKTPSAPSKPIEPVAPFPEWCAFPYHSTNMEFAFEKAQSFSFLELLEAHELMGSGEIGGQIKIAPGEPDQQDPVVVNMALAASDKKMFEHLLVSREDDSIEMRSSAAAAGKGLGGHLGRQCLMIAVTISLKPGVQLSEFSIATTHLNLVAESGLFEDDAENSGAVHISNSTDFTLISGTVSIPFWSSRETVIDVISGSVTGTYALRDLLSIETRSGSIRVEVQPQPVDPSAPAPAEFRADSMSGAVDIRFPTSDYLRDIPERNYITRAETRSGSVKGSFILGSALTLRSISGSVQADILPYTANAEAPNTLTTEARHGSTRLELRSPLRGRREPIAHLRSRHSSISGGINIVYPQEWEGLIQADTTSGSIAVRGRDVEMTDVHKGPVGMHVGAKKGVGGSRLDARTISGSIHATIGDL